MRTTTPLCAILAACACTAGCGTRARTALPLPAAIIEYGIPWADAFPSDVAVDDAGRVWFTDRLTHAIGRLDPETGAVERLPTPTPKSAPYGLVHGPDGALWFAESGAGRLGRVDVRTGRITEVQLPGVVSGPHLLAVQGGRIWFTVRGQGGAYGSHEPGTGATRLYPAPERFRPYGIAADARGRVWVSAYDGWTVLEIDTRTDSVRLHELKTPDPAGERRLAGMPDSLRARYTRMAFRHARTRRMSADGRGRVWVTDFGGGRVLALGAGGGLDAFDSLDPRTEPYGILAARSGVIWYNEKRNDEIVALDPATGERTRFRIPTKGAAVRHIAEDEARGRIWLPLSDRGRIGLIPLRPEAVPRSGR